MKISYNFEKYGIGHGEMQIEQTKVPYDGVQIVLHSHAISVKCYAHDHVLDNLQECLDMVDAILASREAK